MIPKIYLNITKASTLDVQASLDYYEEKKNREGIITEDVYKGKIIFSITEKGKDGKALVVNGKKKYIKSYMDKDIAKVIFHSIMNDKFLDRFGKAGIKAYGGSPDDKSKELRARTTKIYPLLDNDTGKIKHYVFGIDEGKGKHGNNGVPNIDGEPELSVESWVTYVNALKMANEIYDYIRDEELKHLTMGKPLYTLMYGKNGKPQEKAEEVIENNKKKNDEEIVIDIKGVFFGKKITELTDDDLKKFMKIIQKNKNDKAQELYSMAINEAKKRMGRAL